MPGWALALRFIQEHKDPGWGAEFQRGEGPELTNVTGNAECRWKMMPTMEKRQGEARWVGEVWPGAGRRRQGGRPWGPRWKPTVRAEFTCLILSTSERACTWRWVFKEAIKVK